MVLKRKERGVHVGIHFMLYFKMFMFPGKPPVHDVTEKLASLGEEPLSSLELHDSHALPSAAI